ncbi:MAG TPA: ATP-binding cassette domain-containing protein [Pseudomonas sabulinigri]|uniref:ABC transporter domain-containing protein n=1 Tax=marine sediment metagenome TaxID=412755 RepID=A0A0F9YF48_9ZZZZ|nr:ATP-binding cassette domain-containing protein [Halopseudomonas sabulinigri]HEC52969.1 ATP-binding cassette domain-containing protein [Halopseudomonas sabulinigri]
MLYMKNVSTHYGKIQALHEVNLEVQRGEIVTLIGANGAGKTTLLMTLCGDPRATTGSIRYEGDELTGLTTAEIMRKDIAIVPEGRRVFSRLTVEENLSMGAFFTKKEEQQEQLDTTLTLFPRLKERYQQRAGTMSGGEQQMLAIGRALMSKPRLLLLDEPSLGLAPIIIQQIFDIIEQLRQQGVTVFLVEQNANQALKLADRGYVMEHGHIVLQDSGDALLANEDVRKAYLGG